MRASGAVGHSHEHRPFLSRRDFLRRAAVVSGTAVVGGPFFWRQLATAAGSPVTAKHVTFGRATASEASISWSTPVAVDAPFVEVLGSRIAARTVQYPGYPGYFHHAPLAGLPASSDITYGIGHAGAVQPDTAATFRTGPSRRQAFTFTAFGDQGTDTGGQPPQQPSMNTDLVRRFAPSFHLVVGDLAYANGDQSIWDDWFAMIEPVARSVPWMPTIGNHEIESQLTGDAGDSWGAFGYDPYRSRFLLPSNGTDDLANCYYAFRYGSVHVVCIDNNDVNEEVTQNIGYSSGRQQRFVEAELAAARDDPEVDFLVVAMHQCAFSSSTKHGSDEGVRKAWFELFHRCSVDLVLQGHDHTYERTHAMTGDTVASTAEGGTYRSDVGTVYVVCGNGGAVQEPFQLVQPAWSAFRQALKIGTLRIEVQPDAGGGMARMLLTEHWALDGSVIEGGIVLERPVRLAVPDPSPAMVSGTGTSTFGAPVTAPTETLPVTGGPAGIGVLGVAAAAGGLALRRVSREERRDELADELG
jgi:hypothetical protein